MPRNVPSLRPARSRRGVLATSALVLASLVALVVSCGGDAAAGVQLTSAETAFETFENPPEDFVVLDIRTPEEFDAGHLDGAVMIDFYEPGFSDRIAELDRDVTYLMYCRSGNRSGQASALFEQLGFSDVLHVDGGINAWSAAGQPIVGG